MSTLSKKPVGLSTMSGGLTKTFDGAASHSKIDFVQFKKCLEIIGTKCMPDLPLQHAFMVIVDKFILPLGESCKDKRLMQTKLIQGLVTQLDTPEMISLLTILHKQIIDFYKQYADGK